MERRLAWVLNFDAESELAEPEGRDRSPRMRAHCARLETLLRPCMEAALGERPLVLSAGTPPRADAAELDGVTWCATPRALATLRAHGVRPLYLPPVEAVRAGNHRSFRGWLPWQTKGAELDLPDAGFAWTMAELELMLARGPADRRWLLKRPFGFAGRARKLLRRDQLQGPARTWAEASMHQYGRGLQVEPWVEVVGEHSLHGWLPREGPAGLVLGRPLRQLVDDRGAWLGHEVMDRGDLAGSELALLVECAAVCGLRLAELGYFGPYNVEGFRWRDERGRPRFRPVSEVHARFSMGWFLGMDDQAAPLLRQLGPPRPDRPT